MDVKAAPAAHVGIAASFLALLALYAAGLAIVWYELDERWEHMAAAGIPLNLAFGFLVGRWWAPLFAGLAVVVALPDEISYDSGPAWPLALAFVALPSMPVILVGVLARAWARRRRLRPRPQSGPREPARGRGGR